MSDYKKENNSAESAPQGNGSSFSRKKFLKFAGASALSAATLGLVGCDADDGPVGPDPDPMPDAVNLGTGDVGILNYAFALEQLEAAFYIQVLDNRYSGMTDAEVNILGDIRDHEIAHRDWFSAVIEARAGADARIPGLTPNFDSIDFSDRTSVLQTAQVLEDTGVSAYNGAGHLISTDGNGPGYLLQAGKIVSVEARHASSIRNLLQSDSFYGTITGDTALDAALSPADVLSAAGGFIENEIDASGLPQPDDVYL